MFHIVDNWYLVPDAYSWMIARMVGEGTKKGYTYPVWDNQKYLDSPENALKVFAREYVREKARKLGVTGELKDLATFLSSEYEMLGSRIEMAFSWAKERRETSE